MAPVGMLLMGTIAVMALSGMFAIPAGVTPAAQLGPTVATILRGLG